MNRPLLIAHRGFPFQAVENTESSFRLALGLNADVLETDVRLSADGQLVLSHDSDFRRLGGPARPISSFSRSELEQLRLRDGEGREEQPLFMDEALRIFPEAQFNVDLKDSNLRIVDAWIRLLEQSGAGTRCTTASFNDRNLAYFRRRCPGAPVSLARNTVLAQLLSTSLGRPRLPRSGEGVMQLPEYSGSLRVISPRRIKTWQNAGLAIHVWTVDTEIDMRRLANWGVDGIITNRADLFREVFV